MLKTIVGGLCSVFVWAARAGGKTDYIHILYCRKYFEQAITRRVAPNIFLLTVHLKVLVFF